MMRILKRSRRKSTKFDSQFRDGNAANFPLRQYLRCREDFSTGMVHSALILAFVVTLLGFARTLGHLFDRHGTDLNPWYKWMTLAVMGLFVLSVLRRLYYKVMDLREIRQEMARLQSIFRETDDDAGED